MPMTRVQLPRLSVVSLRQFEEVIQRLTGRFSTVQKMNPYALSPASYLRVHHR
jgi:hypothetical protein